MNEKKLTHVAGTFLIQADAAFLNGAGLGEGEDRNVVIPKSYQDGIGNRVPYVSAQAWKRWLRNTLIEETGWPASVLRVIGESTKGTTAQIASELNPIDFVEDDIFGYMWAKKGQGRGLEAMEETDEESEEIEQLKTGKKGEKVRSVMRASPFGASVLISVRRKGWKGLDKAFVHLQEGTPLPYNTEFYNTHLQGIFSLDYSRLGVYWNLGDRIELEEAKVKKLLQDGKIVDVTSQEPYKTLSDNGKIGKVYKITDKVNPAPKTRASALFKALSVLRGGAKQAQFGTDVSPKVLILAGLTCGNPIFNHLFKDVQEGPEFKIDTFKEIIKDYADRIITPVFIGIRAGYLKNEDAVKDLKGMYKVQELQSVRTLMKENTSGQQTESEKKSWKINVNVLTPIESARKIEEYLP
jgi:CRISPR-associated protein Cst2